MDHLEPGRRIGQEIGGGSAIHLLEGRTHVEHFGAVRAGQPQHFAQALVQLTELRLLALEGLRGEHLLGDVGGHDHHRARAPIGHRMLGDLNDDDLTGFFAVPDFAARGRTGEVLTRR